MRDDLAPAVSHAPGCVVILIRDEEVGTVRDNVEDEPIRRPLDEPHVTATDEPGNGEDGRPLHG